VTERRPHGGRRTVPGVAPPVVAAAVAVLAGVALSTGLVGSAAAAVPAGSTAGASLNAATATAAPTASCALSRARIEPGESVTLDAAASENATAYRYDRFGDGNFGEWVDSETRTFVYDEPGTYEPQVQVRSPDDATDTASCGTLTVEENQPPAAAFSYSPSEPTPGETVSFDADASDPDGEVVAYEWRVDGEPVGDGPSLEYIFEERGDHLVELTVTDDDGATDTASRTVTVESENEPPTATFSYSPPAPSRGETVSFTADASDPDGEVVEYAWRVDGEVVGREPTLEYAFEAAGEYVVGLTVMDDDGATDTDTVRVTVESENQPPSANVTYTPGEPTPGETVSFTAEATDPDGEVVAYEWRVDGEVAGEGPTLEYAFPGPGEYEVDLQVTDDGGATDTESVVVIVGEANQPPTVEFDYMPAEPTAGETVAFTAEASDPDGEVAAYEWRVDGEVVGEGAELTYTFEEAGEYLVTVRVTDDDGNTTARERTVVVAEVATATPTPTATPVRTPVETPTGPVSLTAAWWHSPFRPTAGETTTLVARGPADPRVTYRWDIDDDGESERTGPTASVAFPGPGEYTVTLRAVGPDDESVTRSATVPVADQRDPDADDGEGPSFWMRPLDPTPGESVTLVADPAAAPENVSAYRWDIDGDGESDAEGRSVTYAYPGGRFAVGLTIERANGSAVAVEDSVAVGDPTPTARTPTPTPDTDDEPSDTTTAGSTDAAETTTGGQPGLGLVACLAALALVALRGARRDRP
jgi:PKD repeat protein